MSSPTRWAGIPLTDRRTERRALLVEAAFTLFGQGGESAVTVRSVCRETELNSRYFYESFAGTDELLGAVYDRVVTQLSEVVLAAMETAGEERRARTRAGMRAVLAFSSEEPRRGRVLFTDARANSVLAERRSSTQEVLYEMVMLEDSRLHPDSDTLSAKVGAALFTGAMTELVGQWLLGGLGSDVDAVTDYALKRVLGN
jgi:AcrR family transcriptional regulator